MPTGDLAEQRLNEIHSSLDYRPGEFWAPPLAPAATPATGVPLRHEVFGSEPEYDQEQNDFAESGTRFRFLRKLIAGTAIPLAMGVATLAYFWTPAAEKTSTQSVQTAPAAQSSPEAPVQTASSMREASAEAPVAVAWPDPPAASAVESSPQVAAAAPAETSSTAKAAPPWENEEFVFLQRPGVNIRSTPSIKGIVVGTAAKGTRFKVTTREGDWVQIESSRVKGWINSQFVAASKPR